MASECNGFVEEHQDKQNFDLNSIEGEAQLVPRNRYFLEWFSLFKTRSNFYLIGRDKSKRFWRVLKIDRTEPSELVLYEDPTEYSWPECCRLLRRLDDGNRHVGGLRFVSVCYGIVGFIKFLGPTYLLFITERMKVGEVCGHPIYAISKTRLIRIPHKSVLLEVENHSEENRYKKLLCTVDFKDYYFSYSYDLMHSLQQNLCGDETASVSYESAFAWNDFLTQEFRKYLGNTFWTVALVHGFFKQVKFSRSGCKFSLTLIARRSRLHAGPRFLKRGLNEDGQAANDVEIEQIVCGEIGGGFSYKITSMVQNRGSVPLSWCQPTSWVNFKPAISLLNVGGTYKATRIHFEELSRRYGNPIVALSLLKCFEKKPRESVLGKEFLNAVVSINTCLPKENQLEFISMDLDGHFQTEGTKVLTLLNKVAVNIFDRIGFLSYEVVPSVSILPAMDMSKSGELNEEIGNLETSFDSAEDIKRPEKEFRKNNNLCKFHSEKPEKIQNGVLRTNCVDCLDRTNVAQFAYGLLALGNQLRALGIVRDSEGDLLDESLVNKTMEVYKEMGDAIAWQYGGSAARCKMFPEKSGEWKPIIQLKEFIKTLQRYFTNVCLDSRKQKAIDLFLGYLRPGLDQHHLETMEPDSDDSFDVGAPNNLCQDRVSSSLQNNCFLCEGMAYKTLANTTNSSYFSHPEVLPRPSNSETVSKEVSPGALTSETATLENRYSSTLSELQLLAYTDIEEGLWFGSVRSVFSDDQGEISDLDSTSSSV